MLELWPARSAFGGSAGKREKCAAVTVNIDPPFVLDKRSAVVRRRGGTVRGEIGGGIGGACLAGYRPGTPRRSLAGERWIRPRSTGSVPDKSVGPTGEHGSGGGGGGGDWPGDWPACGVALRGVWLGGASQS